MERGEGNLPPIPSRKPEMGSQFIVALEGESRFVQSAFGQFAYHEPTGRRAWRREVTGDPARLAAITNEALDFLRSVKDVIDVHIDIVEVSAGPAVAPPPAAVEPETKELPGDLKTWVLSVEECDPALRDSAEILATRLVADEQAATAKELSGNRLAGVPHRKRADSCRLALAKLAMPPTNPSPEESHEELRTRTRRKK